MQSHLDLGIRVSESKFLPMESIHWGALSIRGWGGIRFVNLTLAPCIKVLGGGILDPDPAQIQVAPNQTASTDSKDSNAFKILPQGLRFRVPIKIHESKVGHMHRIGPWI